jgi:protein-tyrosine phosphatase
VYVGGWSDAVEFQGARICVLDEAPDDEPVPGNQQVPIYDPQEDQPIVANLDRIVRMAGSARKRDEPVLFFCGHGIRRGPLAGAWYLHRSQGVSLDTAYEHVRSVRPKTEHVKEWVGDWKILYEPERLRGK